MEFQALLQIGDIVDASDEDGIFFEAKVIDKDEQFIEVAYAGWSERWNSKIEIGSKRIKLANSIIPEWRSKIKLYDIVEIYFSTKWFSASVIDIIGDTLRVTSPYIKREYFEIHRYDFFKMCRFRTHIIDLQISVAHINAGLLTSTDHNIHNVCRGNNLYLLKSLLEKNPDLINLKGDNDMTPLMLCVVLKKTEFAKTLIEYGADIETTDCHNSTPLINACKLSTTYMAEYLVHKGVNIDRKNDNGRTALFYAIDRRLDAIVDLLLSGGADLNARDIYGITPLTLRIKRNRTNYFYNLNDITNMINLGGDFFNEDLSGNVSINVIKNTAIQNKIIMLFFKKHFSMMREKQKKHSHNLTQMLLMLSCHLYLKVIDYL